jgi:hypothetical protein
MIQIQSLKIKSRYLFKNITIKVFFVFGLIFKKD